MLLEREPSPRLKPPLGSAAENLFAFVDLATLVPRPLPLPNKASLALDLAFFLSIAFLPLALALATAFVLPFPFALAILALWGAYQVRVDNVDDLINANFANSCAVRFDTVCDWHADWHAAPPGSTRGRPRA